jgi:hypothetical protein
MCFATLGCCEHEAWYDVYVGSGLLLKPDGTRDITKPIFVRDASCLQANQIDGSSQDLWWIPPTPPMVMSPSLTTGVGGLSTSDSEFVWAVQLRNPNSANQASPTVPYLVGYDVVGKVERFAKPCGAGTDIVIGPGNPLGWIGHDRMVWLVNNQGVVELHTIFNSGFGGYEVTTTSSGFHNNAQTTIYQSDGVHIIHEIYQYTRPTALCPRCWPRAFGTRVTVQVDRQPDGSPYQYKAEIKNELVVGNLTMKTGPTAVGDAATVSASTATGLYLAVTDVADTVNLTITGSDTQTDNNGYGYFSFTDYWAEWAWDHDGIVSSSSPWTDASETNYIGAIHFPTQAPDQSITYDIRINQDGKTAFTIPARSAPAFGNAGLQYISWVKQGFGGHAAVTRQPLVGEPGMPAFPLTPVNGYQHVVKGYKDGLEQWTTKLLDCILYAVDCSQNWFYLIQTPYIERLPISTIAMPNCSYPTSRFYTAYLVANDGSASVPFGRHFALPSGNPDATGGEPPGLTVSIPSLYAVVRRDQIPFVLPSTSF